MTNREKERLHEHSSEQCSTNNLNVSFVTTIFDDTKILYNLGENFDNQPNIDDNDDHDPINYVYTRQLST